MADLSRLESDVEAQTSVVASVQTLLSGLAAQIADLKNSVTDPTAQAAIDALADKIEANSKALGDAVEANTPAA